MDEYTRKALAILAEYARECGSRDPTIQAAVGMIADGYARDAVDFYENQRAKHGSSYEHTTAR